MQRRILCPHCTGRCWMTCEACEGNGFIETRYRGSFMDDSDSIKSVICSKCHGDKTAKCPRCSGRGFL